MIVAGWFTALVFLLLCCLDYLAGATRTAFNFTGTLNFTGVTGTAFNFAGTGATGAAWNFFFLSADDNFLRAALILWLPLEGVAALLLAGVDLFAFFSVSGGVGATGEGLLLLHGPVRVALVPLKYVALCMVYSF